MSLMFVSELVDAGNQFAEIPGDSAVILLGKGLMIKENLHAGMLSGKQVLFESGFHVR
ncbi:hypothetical protein ACS5NO_31185 [Larkinella sp. GY13]|uniref:hypothetical protein n=1 Tax=Larkinella sp. GY13 TaxID=3453720 RepID=UPI003EE9194E